MKRKRFKKSKKPCVLVFALILILVSFYFYCDVNVRGDLRSESKLNIYSENPRKYIIVLNTDKNGDFLCESPINNFCFYQGVYYDEKETDDKLYTYFENEYREVIEAEGGFFIKEEKYSENLSLKVGQKSKNRVSFFRSVYKKENLLTKNERIISLIKYFLEKSRELNYENKVSFIFSDGSFTDFIKLSDINEKALNELLNQNRTSVGDLLIKNKLISLTENEENISVIYFTGGNKVINFTKEDELNFKNIAFINLLSPEDILGKAAEKYESLGENFNKADIFSESGEKYMGEIFYNIHKNEPLTLVRDP